MATELERLQRLLSPILSTRQALGLIPGSEYQVALFEHPDTASDNLMDHLPEVTELSGPHTDWQRLSELALDALEVQAEELARLREVVQFTEPPEWSLGCFLTQGAFEPEYQRVIRTAITPGQCGRAFLDLRDTDPERLAQEAMRMWDAEAAKLHPEHPFDYSSRPVFVEVCQVMKNKPITLEFVAPAQADAGQHGEGE